MINIEIAKTVGLRFLGRGLLVAQKFSPQILTGIGVVGGVTAAVMACRATLELEQSLEYSKSLIDGHKQLREEKTEEEYPTAVYQRDIAISYFRGVQAVIKLYGPSVALGGLSIASILSGHGILHRRNAALMVAYNALETAFKSYRKRVIEDFGEEKDWDYRHGIREEVTETVNANGKKSRSKSLTQDPNGISQYARVFAEGHPEWRPNAEMNLFWLKCKQTYLNDMLLSKGHLTLNEAYDELGFPRTQAGFIVGWIIDKNSDCYVDFGLLDLDKPNARDFINGYENSVVLDFNVDGVIFDRI